VQASGFSQGEKKDFQIERITLYRRLGGTISRTLTASRGSDFYAYGIKFASIDHSEADSSDPRR
jgi:hypothetical protein